MRFTSTFYKSEDVFVPLNRKENLAAAANFVCNLHRRIWVKLRIWSNNTINWHDGLLEILRKVWPPVLPFLLALIGGLIFSFLRNTATINAPGHPAVSGFSSLPYLSTLITVLGGGLVAVGLVKFVNDLVKALRGNLGIDFEKFKRKPAYRQQVAFWDQFSKEFESIVKLCGQGKPLVVMIDDLDRCLPEDALQVLEAIKNLLDVEGCIFLLGLDRKIVEKALAVKYKDMFENQSGRESVNEEVLSVKRFFYEDYVDKIFQLAITLPKLSTPESRRRFIRGATSDADVRVCREVFSIGLSPNPRRIKRVLRTFLLICDIAFTKEEKAIKEKLIEGSNTLIEWKKVVIKRLLLAKLIIIQSEFSIIFDAITENPALLKDLEKYYLKSAKNSNTDSLNKDAGAGGDNKNNVFEHRAEKYTADYPMLPKILIEGGSEEAYFSKLEMGDINQYIVLVGALVPADTFMPDVAQAAAHRLSRGSKIQQSFDAILKDLQPSEREAERSLEADQ